MVKSHKHIVVYLNFPVNGVVELLNTRETVAMVDWQGVQDKLAM